MPVLIKTMAELREAKVLGRVQSIWGTATVVYAWVHTADMLSMEMWSVTP